MSPGAGKAAAERLWCTPTPPLSAEETGDILGSGLSFLLPLYPECCFVSCGCVTKYPRGRLRTVETGPPRLVAGRRGPGVARRVPSGASGDMGAGSAPASAGGRPPLLSLVCLSSQDGHPESVSLCPNFHVLWHQSLEEGPPRDYIFKESVCKQGLGGREFGRASFSPVQAAFPSRAHGTALWPPGGGVPRPSTRSLPGTAAPHSTPALPLLLPGLGAWHVVVFVCFLLVLLISLSPSPLSLLERRF